jgi:hypothetical protein
VAPLDSSGLEQAGGEDFRRYRIDEVRAGE